MNVSPNTRWMGLLHWALISLGLIFGLIFGLSLIDLILSAVWAGKLLNSDTRDEQTKPATSTLVFYSATMPVLTIIWAALNVALTRLLSQLPILPLITSVVIFCGWMIQFNVWMYCEVTAPNIEEQSPSWCPNSSVWNGHRARYGIGMGKDWLGLIIMVAVLAYITLAAMAIARGRKASKQSFGMQKISDDTQALTES